MPIASLNPQPQIMKGLDVFKANLVPMLVNGIIGGFLFVLGGGPALVKVIDKVRGGQPIGPTEIFSHIGTNWVQRFISTTPVLAGIIVMQVLTNIVVRIVPVTIVMYLLQLVTLAVMLATMAIASFAAIAVARDDAGNGVAAVKNAIKKVMENPVTNGGYMALCCLVSICPVLFSITVYAWIEGYEASGGIQAK